MRLLVTSAYGYWGAFNPHDLDTGERQIGGGETAMIQVSRALAKLGHEVMVFYNVERPGKYDGVDYLPRAAYTALVTLLEHDVLISWDDPDAFRYADRATARVLAFQLNAAQVGVFDHVVDLYMHPSEWHLERYCGLYPEISRDKCRARITNGIDPQRYAKDVERLPHRVIYSASPDRGLHHLLRLWPAVRERIPDATLEVFYEIANWLNMALGNPYTEIDARARAIKAALDEPPPGVTFHGSIGQMQLATEQLKSAVMAYPCDPVQPTEGFSMTCLEAVTAGCKLVTTDADALKELWADSPGATIIPLPVDDAVWVETIVQKLQDPEPSGRVRISDDYTWTAIAKRWEKELADCVQNKRQ